MPFLPESFDYHPPTLAALEDALTSLTPAWAGLIGEGRHVHALQIAESELETLLACGCSCEATIARHKIQIAVTYLTLDKPNFAADYLREAYEHFEGVSEEHSEVEELLSLSSLWFETLVTLGRSSEAEIPLAQIRALNRAAGEHHSESEAKTKWCSFLLGAIEYCREFPEASGITESLHSELVECRAQLHGEGSYEHLEAKSRRAEFFYVTDQGESCRKEYAEVRRGLRALKMQRSDLFALACLRGAQCAFGAGEIAEAQSLSRSEFMCFDPEGDALPYQLRDYHMVRAQIEFQLGRSGEAIRHLEAGIRTVEQANFGPGQILGCIAEAIEVVCLAGAVEVEEQLLRKAFSISEVEFGAGNDATLRAQQNLISFLDRCERREQCLAENERYLLRCKQAHGEQSVVFIEASIEVAAAFFALGRGEQGERVLLQSLAAARKHLALPERKIILNIVAALGDYHQRREERTESFRYRELGVRLSRLYCGTQSATHADMLLAAACTYFNFDEFSCAEALAERALDAASSVEGQDLMQAAALDQIGYSLLARHDYPGAEYRFEQGRECLERSGNLGTGAAVRLFDGLAEAILEQTQVSPDRERERAALAHLVSADRISRELQHPDSEADAVRYHSILTLAGRLEQFALAERCEIAITRLAMAGIRVVGNEGGDLALL